jgi:hypothetical protein
VATFDTRRYQNLHTVRRQHFHCAHERRLGERMRVDTEKKRPVDSLPLPVVANGLCDCQDVPFVEGVVEC